MLRRLPLIALLTILFAPWATAEDNRPLLVKENRFPDARELETGATFLFVELVDNDEAFGSSDTNQWTAAPYLRYGLTKNLAVYGLIPFNNVEPDEGDGESGLGDIAVGFELKAYEDLFGFPWVVPHIELSLDTGDEDKGLGRGENAVTLGVSVGSKAWDVCSFILDGSYQVFEDSDNIGSVSGAIVWDVSEQFALLVEARLTDEENEDDGSENPMLFLGGFSYRPNEDLAFTAEAGGGKNTREDVLFSLKLAYTL